MGVPNWYIRRLGDEQHRRVVGPRRPHRGRQKHRRVWEPPVPIPAKLTCWATTPDDQTRRVELVWEHAGELPGYTMYNPAALLPLAHTDRNCHQLTDPGDATRERFSVRDLNWCDCSDGSAPRRWFKLLADLTFQLPSVSRPYPPLLGDLHSILRNSVLDQLAAVLDEIGDRPGSPARRWIDGQRPETPLRCDPDDGVRLVLTSSIGLNTTFELADANDRDMASAITAWLDARLAGRSSSESLDAAVKKFRRRVGGAGEAFADTIAAIVSRIEADVAAAADSYQPFGTHLLRCTLPAAPEDPPATESYDIGRVIESYGLHRGQWAYAVVRVAAVCGPLHIADLDGEVFAVPAAVAAHLSAAFDTYEDLGQLTAAELAELQAGDTPLVVALLPAIAGTEHEGFDQLAITRLLT